MTLIFQASYQFGEKLKEQAYARDGAYGTVSVCDVIAHVYRTY